LTTVSWSSGIAAAILNTKAFPEPQSARVLAPGSNILFDMAVIDMAFVKRQGMPQMPTDPEYYSWSVQRQLSAITLSLMIVSFVAVVGRVYIRLYVLRLFRLDDYFMVAAMVSCTVGQLTGQHIDIAPDLQRRRLQHLPPYYPARHGQTHLRDKA
jgi:hypothetical protein